ncbi:MAG: menaquinone biosynthesis protein [Fimbriimonadales bacterium]|nr:menaquinone biosynthesis protein [Fimbriimonadales bacterium]
MTHVLGSIPFVNGAPLVHPFLRLGEASPVRVVEAVPSDLPGLLESGQAEAILVSSIDALRTPGRTACAGVCIGTRGMVESVRLFSKVPFDAIGTLAEDASSMTSNALARVILAESFGARPRTRRLPPNLYTMLEACDACVLIGDIGMTADGTGLYVLDLGQAWVALTGLPFVWALCVGDERLTPEMAGWMNWARGRSGCGADAEGPPDEQLIRAAADRAGMDRELVRAYLTRTMSYRLDDAFLSGLRAFGRYLVRHGIVASAALPRFVEPADVG